MQIIILFPFTLDQIINGLHKYLMDSPRHDSKTRHPRMDSSRADKT